MARRKDARGYPLAIFWISSGGLFSVLVGHKNYGFTCAMRSEVNQLHLTESLVRLGGVETLVRQLISASPENYAAALLDAPTSVNERGIGLRVGKLAGAWLVRRTARARLPYARHLIFHNFAGLMMLAGAIRHERKSLFLHTNSTDVFELLPQRIAYLDAILVSGADLERELHARFPNLPVPVTAVEYPLDDRYFDLPRPHPKGPLVLGYSGRLEVEQKQVFRLVELCRLLGAAGLPFTLEIAGSGGAMAELRRQLPAGNCRFLGALDAAELRAAYQRWQFLVCTSDYETGPLVALEAMAAGVIPILPEIPCQATALVAGLDLPLYPRGNMAAAVAIITRLAGDARTGELVTLLQEKVADRRVERFVARIDAVLAAAAARPALALTPPVSRGPAELLPFVFRRGRGSFLR